MAKRINQLKIGSLLSYGQMFLNILIGLVYTPIMIRLLGQSEYGLYHTVSSVISMLSILNLGFNAGYVRYYSKYKSNGDTEGIQKLNGLFLIVFTIIGLVALACGLFLSFHLEWVFDEGFTTAEYETAKVLMLLLTGSLAISFPCSVFSHIISVHERFVFLKLIGMLRTVLSPLITLPVLLLGHKSIALVIVNVTVSLIVDVIYILYVKLTLKQRFCFKQFEKGLFKSLLVYTSFIAINLIVDQINWNIDKFLLGRYKGTVAVAVYAVGYALYSYYMMFSISTSNVFTPRIHKIVSETSDNTHLQRQRLTELFTRVGRIQFLILGLLATGVVFFGKPFIYFWAGDGYEEAYWVAVLLILSSSIALIQNLGIEIQRAENKHQFRSFVYLGMALINLVASIFLCRKYGAVGCALGTAASLILANGLIMNIYYHTSCNIDVISFWKSILRACVGLVAPIAFGILTHRYIDLYNIWMLVLFIGCYSIVYFVSMWLLAMNDYEKNLIKKPLRRIIKRKNADG